MAVASIAMLQSGCEVSRPGRLETHVAAVLKHRVTVGDKHEKSPVPLTPETLASGREAFNSYCIACHGLDGQNTGVPFAERMDPPVPSLASADVQSYTDGQLKWVIDNGIAPSGMPASKGMLSDEEVWSVVHYLRHLPAAGSLGEPAIYSH